MLEELRITAFKAYGGETTVPLRPFTLLVGPNGAGKSTVLQGVDLLGGLVRSTLPEYLQAHDWDYADLPHLRAGTAEIRLVALVRLEGELLEWTLTLGKRRRPGIAGETVFLLPRDPKAKRLPLLWRVGRQMRRLVENDQRVGEAPLMEGISQTLTSSWLGALDTGNDDDLARFPRLCRLADWARRIRGHFFLDPVKLRAAGRGHIDALGPNGENLAPFIAALRKERPADFKELVARVKEHYPRLESLEPIRAEYGWTQLEVEERWNGERARFNARQVSDGLLRLVAIAAMHAVQPATSILLLDEVENGMHPQLLGHFIEMLQELTPQTQVIATTHSPLALSFTRDDNGIIIVDRGRGGVPRCVPLPTVKRYSKLRSHFDAGELWYNLGEETLLK